MMQSTEPTPKADWNDLSECEQASLDGAVRELFAQFAPIYGHGVVRERLERLATLREAEGS